MAGGVAFDLGGHIVGEVVRKAADDGCGGRGIPGREAADSRHVIHRASNPGARRVVPGQHEVGKAANHEDNEVHWSTNRGFRAER